jgi:transcriptional regulator with XRE-family HTH domain
MEIGDRIKELRTEKGLTLKELGERIGMSVSFLSDVENSRSLPSLKRCKQIAIGLSVPVSVLLCEDAPKSHLPVNDMTYAISFSSTEAKHLSELLCDFDDWASHDQNELISYLKSKKAIRTQNK